MSWRVSQGIVLVAMVMAMVSQTQADEVSDFITEFDTKASEVYNELNIASWNYNTDITDENMKTMLEVQSTAANMTKVMSERAAALDISSADVETMRIIDKIKDQGSAALDDQDYTNLKLIMADMEAIYSTGTVTIDKEELALSPGLTELFATSLDYVKLRDAWVGWRDTVGKPVKQQFKAYTDYLNDAAKINNYSDAGEYWRAAYEEPNLREVILGLYEELEPLYKELHAYIRRKLYIQYGSDNINLEGPIPAHLLGNMWAQSWMNLYDRVVPYPDAAKIDITKKLKDLSIRNMFNMSNEFFTSMGLESVTESFYENSVLEKPADKDMVCHASAWDFMDGADFRIKMCTENNKEDFITIHHEMGHIQYYLQYKDQPLPFRSGANPGFHEAVGDTISLSVQTPKHLQTIGLLEDYTETNESDINYLMSQALDKISLLPFAMVMDLWRWDLFRGDTEYEDYNDAWWALRLKYQGIVPPLPRDKDDFDPGAKYHISGGVPYVRYFVSHILQFQFYKGMCVLANHEGDLHNCDFYGNTEAGAAMKAMLEFGSSIVWPDVLNSFLQQSELSTVAIKEYFDPLYLWLQIRNELNGDVTGWPNDNWTPPYSGSTTLMTSLMTPLVCIVAAMLR